MLARSVEVVVKRRVWEALNACARAILWRQGRHTDPNEGSWNNVRFIVAAKWHEIELASPSIISEFN